MANDLLKYTKELVVENGGDIYIAGTKERIAGIYAGNSCLGKLGIKVSPEDLPVSICTSSATVGHSLSFGKADAVTVLSKDACIADAAATAVGNMVKSADDIEKALKKAQNISGVTGVIIIIGEQMGVWGKIQLVRI